MNNHIYIANNQIVLNVKYNANLIENVKQRTYSGRWDPAHKHWTFNLLDAPILLDIATEYHLNVSDDIVLYGNKYAKARFNLILNNQKQDLVLRVKFNENLIADLKHLGGVWNKEWKYWRYDCDPENVESLIQFCERNFLSIHPDVLQMRGRFTRQEDKQKELTENDVVEIPTIQFDINKEYLDFGMPENLEKHESPEAYEYRTKQAAYDLTLIDKEKWAESLRPFQVEGVEFLLRTRRAFLCDDMGLGKDQPLWSKILTPTGWVTMGNMVEGQEIIGKDGNSYQVTGVFPQGIKEVFELTFADGTTAHSGREHLWPFIENGCTTVRPLESLLKKADEWYSHEENISIPVIDRPINITENSEETNLNTLSYLLVNYEMLPSGQHGLPFSFPTNVENSYSSPEFVTIQAHLNQLNIPFTVNKLRPRGGFYRIELQFEYTPWIQEDQLVKVIPETIIFNQALRQELLLKIHGLRAFYPASSGSTYMVNGPLSFVEALVPLINAEGSTCALECVKGNSYRLRVSWNHSLGNFKVTKKLSKKLLSVLKIGEEPTQCISVSAPDKLYVTDGFITTHNTVQASRAMYAGDLFPALIVCPASLKQNWLRETNKWIPDREAIIWDNPDQDISDINIINYDRLSKIAAIAHSKKFKCIIFDECHYLKSEISKRSKTALSIVKDTPFIWMLTGTPVLNRPVELVQPLKIINRIADMGGVKHFKKFFCGERQTPFGLQAKGATNLHELKSKLNKFLLRRLKQEVLKELPDKSRYIQYLDIANRAEYNQRFEEITDELFGDEIPQSVADDPASIDDWLKRRRARHLVLLTEMRQIAVNGKMNAAKEWIENFLLSGEKVIIFAYHTEVIKELHKKFGGRTITGETSLKERDEIVQAFQNDSETRLLIMNTKAGGVGLTLTASSNVLFLELSWTPAELDQAEDRVYRIGQKNSVSIYYLIGTNTIEESMWQLIQQKRNVTRSIIDEHKIVETQGIFEDLMTQLKEKHENKHKN